MNKNLKIIVLMLSIFFIAWIIYGADYLYARQIVLHNYGGVGQGCSGATASPGTFIFRSDENYYAPKLLKPFYLKQNFTYLINPKNLDGRDASGFVTRFGTIHESYLSGYCLLQ